MLSQGVVKRMFRAHVSSVARALHPEDEIYAIGLGGFCSLRVEKFLYWATKKNVSNENILQLIDEYVKLCDKEFKKEMEQPSLL